VALGILGEHQDRDNDGHRSSPILLPNEEPSYSVLLGQNLYYLRSGFGQIVKIERKMGAIERVGGYSGL